MESINQSSCSVRKRPLDLSLSKTVNRRERLSVRTFLHPCDRVPSTRINRIKLINLNAVERHETESVFHIHTDCIVLKRITIEHYRLLSAHMNSLVTSVRSAAERTVKYPHNLSFAQRVIAYQRQSVSFCRQLITNARHIFLRTVILSHRSWEIHSRSIQFTTFHLLFYNLQIITIKDRLLVACHQDSLITDFRDFVYNCVNKRPLNNKRVSHRITSRKFIAQSICSDTINCIFRTSLQCKRVAKRVRYNISSYVTQFWERRQSYSVKVVTVKQRSHTVLHCNNLITNNKLITERVFPANCIYAYREHIVHLLARRTSRVRYNHFICTQIYNFRSIDNNLFS